MFCEKCGAKNSKENTFCEKCGERLVSLEENKNQEEKKERKKKDELVERNNNAKKIELLFEREKYDSYIGKIQKSITMTYVYWVGFGLIISLIILSGSSYQSEMSRFVHHDGENMMKIVAIFPPIISFAIAHARTLEKKIRVQEMKWKMDFYSKHIN